MDKKKARENVGTMCIDVVATVQVNGYGDYLTKPLGLDLVSSISQQIGQIDEDRDDHWGAVICTKVRGPWKPGPQNQVVSENEKPTAVGADIPNLEMVLRRYLSKLHQHRSLYPHESPNTRFMRELTQLCELINAVAYRKNWLSIPISDWIRYFHEREMGNTK